MKLFRKSWKILFIKFLNMAGELHKPNGMINYPFWPYQLMNVVFHLFQNVCALSCKCPEDPSWCTSGCPETNPETSELVPDGDLTECLVDIPQV